MLISILILICIGVFLFSMFSSDDQPEECYSVIGLIPNSIHKVLDDWVIGKNGKVYAIGSNTVYFEICGKRIETRLEYKFSELVKRAEFEMNAGKEFKKFTWEDLLKPVDN